ncbi:hypothetical protein [Neobacillus ginsengisoli]|uniref:Uncharacterized protein n=1 Tax=Neobacillus ginsengisoli TaxID=904295 RepID=A0ABT9XX34_9BACI|nr:hypothetical protein [Neobacillus ginsengisoli]MDQ0200051.1 hypothetical protein [Neobacillus ginsengisoli]
MDLLLEQCEHNHAEEPCEECAPKKEREEDFDIFEYDYQKRIWF